MARISRTAAGSGSATAFSARGDGETDAAEIVVLVVVTVPAAMILLEIENQSGCAAGIADGLVRIEDGFARLIAQAGAGVDAPAGFVFAINGEFDGTGDAALLAFVVEDFGEIGVRED